MKKIETALKTAKVIVNSMEDEKMQEIKYLSNPRCRKANFSYLEYLIGRFAEYLGEPAPTSDEIEKLVRNMW